MNYVWPYMPERQLPSWTRLSYVGHTPQGYQTPNFSLAGPMYAPSRGFPALGIDGRAQNPCSLHGCGRSSSLSGYQLSGIVDDMKQCLSLCQDADMVRTFVESNKSCFFNSDGSIRILPPSDSCEQTWLKLINMVQNSQTGKMIPAQTYETWKTRITKARGGWEWVRTWGPWIGAGAAGVALWVVLR